MPSYLLLIAGSFAICLPLMFLSRTWALAIDLVDRPDDRKCHLGEVPMAGGLAIVSGALIIGVTCSLLGIGIDEFTLSAFTLCTLAAIVGAVDDRSSVSPRIRLCLQFGMALLGALVFDFQVRELGNILGTGTMSPGPGSAVAFTAFCIVGVVNATNMLDGMDGLLSGTAVVSLAAIAWLVASTGGSVPPLLALYVLGALLAFLLLNLGVFGERHRIFLGDSGAMFLGLLLALSLVDRSQGPAAVMPAVSAGWILGLPLLDTVVVIVRRLRAGRSPFSAGRDHLHHRLMNLGLSQRRTLVVMLALHGVMVGIGLWSATVSLAPWILFYGFMVLTVAAYRASFVLDRRAVPRVPAAVPVTPGDARRGRLRPAAGPIHALRQALREAAAQRASDHSRKDVGARIGIATPDPVQANGRDEGRAECRDEGSFEVSTGSSRRAESRRARSAHVSAEME